jgi:hypothetical protein
MTRGVAFTAVTVASLACYPTTTRPAFLPEATAPTTELELGVPQATRAVALQLDEGGIPIRRTEPKDGWLESDWFDPRTFKATSARTLGPNVVKVRAWIDPSRPNYSKITVEAVYRPLADPSRAPRELDRELPDSNPALIRVQQAVAKLLQQYGGEAVDTTPAVAPVVKAIVKAIHGVDTSRAAKPGSPDTTAVPAKRLPRKLPPADTTASPRPATPVDTSHVLPKPARDTSRG